MERIGDRLARLRRLRGLTQVELARRLCDATGATTVTRHEVSRWERAERLPGEFWRGWLAVVLGVPWEHIDPAAADGRSGAAPPAPDPEPGGHPRLWQPVTPGELLAALDRRRDGEDPRRLAHAWLTGPAPGFDRACPPTLVPHLTEAGARDRLSALAARLSDLRRQDDQVGGLDHAGLVDRELRAAVRLLREIRPRHRLRRRTLRLVAGYAQLAGWVWTDAGHGPAARSAYRVALRAAALAGDRPLAGYVLGSLSHQCLAAGQVAEALELARTAYAGAAAATPLAEALLLHRIALAAAGAGERRAAEAALARAGRAAARAGPEPEPDWLYWLDGAELAAMSGRCWAALGRPLRAVRLLALPRPAAPAGAAGLRTSALYGALLARGYLDLGEIERATQVARRALRQAVAAGSVRAAAAVRMLHPQLLRHGDLPIVQQYERRAAGAFTWLPAAGRQPGRASV